MRGRAKVSMRPLLKSDLYRISPTAALSVRPLVAAGAKGSHTHSQAFEFTSEVRGNYLGQRQVVCVEKLSKMGEHCCFLHEGSDFVAD